MPIAAPFYVKRVIKDSNNQIVVDQTGEVMEDESDLGTVQDWTILPAADPNYIPKDSEAFARGEEIAPAIPTYFLICTWTIDTHPAVTFERPEDLKNVGPVDYVDADDDDENESEEDEE